MSLPTMEELLGTEVSEYDLIPEGPYFGVVTGAEVKKGPKGPGEHTRWIVYVVPEDYTCSFQELSRAVRLAHSIRAMMLWAIVDNENNVTYYKILRLRP